MTEEGNDIFDPGEISSDELEREMRIDAQAAEEAEAAERQAQEEQWLNKLHRQRGW